MLNLSHSTKKNSLILKFFFYGKQSSKHIRNRLSKEQAILLPPKSIAL